MKIEKEWYFFYYDLKPNYQKRTYTIRYKDVKTNRTYRKLRTLPMRRDLFDDFRNWHFNDVQDFIFRSEMVYHVKTNYRK